MINEIYSFKAYPYHGLSLKDRPVAEFNNSEIVGSCFYQEWLKGDAKVLKDIFPDGMTGVVFKRCNLDNIKIPAGNTVDPDCSNRRIKVQNDLEDWILNTNDEPDEPIDKAAFIRLNISINPTDIPAQELAKPRVKTARQERDRQEAG